MVKQDKILMGGELDEILYNQRFLVEMARFFYSKVETFKDKTTLNLAAKRFSNNIAFTGLTIKKAEIGCIIAVPVDLPNLITAEKRHCQIYGSNDLCKISVVG
ncbi:8096_t:CDS:2 [Funneliformis mosseae]|uniref:8096_t:CDS:1 n=1 Tax=Funneliformis mosseae TaxID=27381 RepID=A0A9N9I1M3_FUNMO|nr:8096_t:CDS:2 [Funneliformis mosseae]